MKKLVIAALAVSLLAGCTTLKKVTGQTNDNVLPGQRENILPPDQQVARDPAVTGQQPSSQANVPSEPVTGQPPQSSPPAAQSATVADPNCDPNVDLCPEALPPEPLPPPSKPLPKEPVTTDKTKAGMSVPDTKKKKKKKKLVVAKTTATPPATQPAQ